MLPMMSLRKNGELVMKNDPMDMCRLYDFENHFAGMVSVLC